MFSVLVCSRKARPRSRPLTQTGTEMNSRSLRRFVVAELAGTFFGDVPNDVPLHATEKTAQIHPSPQVQDYPPALDFISIHGAARVKDFPPPGQNCVREWKAFRRCL